MAIDRLAERRELDGEEMAAREAYRELQGRQDIPLTRRRVRMP